MTPSAGISNLVHAEINAAVLNEHVDFPKAPGIEEQAQPLARRQFALFLVPGNRLLAAHPKNLGFPLLEILYFIFNHTHACVPFICSKSECYGSGMSQPV